MNPRIKDKINDLEKYLEELYSIVPSSFNIYESDLKAKAACERYAEKVIEAAVDLGFLVIKDKKLNMPENDIQIFEILLSAGIISEDLSENLQKAKGMRNVIAHEYGTVNDEIVFDSIHENLEKDIREFILAVKHYLKSITVQ